MPIDQDHPSQNRPRSPKTAPEPETSYERVHHGKNPDKMPAGGGAAEPDPSDMSVGQDNAQPPDRQINAQDEPTGATAPAQPLNQPDLSKRGY